MEPNEIHIERTILKFDVKNLNDRIYPRETFEKALAEYNKKIEYKRALGTFNPQYGLGEFEHPDLPSDFEIIKFKNVSHLIENIRLEGNLVIANIRVLNTECGNLLKEVLDGVVFRPRSTGTIDSDGNVTIDKLISIDAIIKDTDSFKGLIDE